MRELAEKIGAGHHVKLYTRTDSTEDILCLFSTRTVLDNPTAAVLYHRSGPVEDVVDDKGKVLVRGFNLISDKTTANAIAKLKLPTLEILSVNKYVEATVEHDTATDAGSALLTIYKNIRPGDPATPGFSPKPSAEHLLRCPSLRPGQGWPL